MRENRKNEQIENFLRTTASRKTLLDEVFVENDSLLELDYNEVDTSCTFLGRKINYPFIISAITGGSELSSDINKNLASLAKKFNVPLELGSQTVMFENADRIESFRIARETAGEKGIIISNLNANQSIDNMKRASEVVNANAISLHLNVPQELVMEDGDRKFKGRLKNIERAVKELEIPVIVKETGFGMSRKTVRKLEDIGVQYIDCSGSGGSNFIEIENMRNQVEDYTEFFSWGIPTALSIINSVEEAHEAKIIGSGGIRDAMDMLKAMILGCDYVAMAGELLRYVVHGGAYYSAQFLESTLKKFKVAMMLVGAKKVDDIKNTPYTLHGRLAELVRKNG